MILNSDPAQLLTQIKTISAIEGPDYLKVKDFLYHNLFSKIPVIINRVDVGNPIFRTVPIYRDDLSYGRKVDLSYRPLEYKYDFFNRCSEPEQRHFYCSTDRQLSMGECSYFLSNLDGYGVKFDRDHELLELGFWEANRPIYLADLRFGNFTHPENKEFQQNLQGMYNDFVKDDFIKDFFMYINHKFEQPVKKAEYLKYWLTACYSNYLFDEWFKPQPNWGTIRELNFAGDMQIDGILYHSVQGIKTNPPMKGFNMALRTKLIDDNSLTLNKAGIFVTEQTGQFEFTFDRLIKINDDIKGDT